VAQEEEKGRKPLWKRSLLYFLIVFAIFVLVPVLIELFFPYTLTPYPWPGLPPFGGHNYW
jgi:hypothetical protein